MTSQRKSTKVNGGQRRSTKAMESKIIKESCGGGSRESNKRESKKVTKVNESQTVNRRHQKPIFEMKSGR